MKTVDRHSTIEIPKQNLSVVITLIISALLGGGGGGVWAIKQANKPVADAGVITRIIEGVSEKVIRSNSDISMKLELQNMQLEVLKKKMDNLSEELGNLKK